MNDPINWIDPPGLLFGIDAGESYGESAAMYYAGITNDPCASWAEKAGAWAGGLFASLWTPGTSDATFATLGAGYAAAGWAASTGGAAAWPSLSFGRSGNNYFRMIDRANKLGFRVDKAHTGHAAKGALEGFKQKYPHPHFWSW